jgi:hypothetical protein
LVVASETRKAQEAPVCFRLIGVAVANVGCKHLRRKGVRRHEGRCEMERRPSEL